MTPYRTHTITLLIVDDHPFIRDGLATILALEDDMRVVGQCATGREAILLTRKLQPAIVILDINLPDVNGLQVLRAIKEHARDTAVLMLTAYDDAEQSLHAMRAGANAYCRKDIEPPVFVENIRAIMHGTYMIEQERMDARGVQQWIQRHLAGVSSTDEKAWSHYQPLSSREMEILRCITQGLSNKEIAYRLQISQQTVKNHMTSILRKMNVDDRTQAAITALKYGWVRLEAPVTRRTALK